MSFLKFTIKENFTEEMARKLADASSKAEHALATQIETDTAPFVPMLTGALTDNTRVYGNQIVYPGPYARYLYEGKVMVDSVTGKGPMKIMKDGQVVAIRFRKGATLRPTEKLLDIKKRSGHFQATDHWLEASKTQNLEKWTRVAGRLIKDEL